MYKKLIALSAAGLLLAGCYGQSEETAPAVEVPAAVPAVEAPVVEAPVVPAPVEAPVETPAQ